MALVSATDREEKACNIMGSTTLTEENWKRSPRRGTKLHIDPSGIVNINF